MRENKKRFQPLVDRSLLTHVCSFKKRVPFSFPPTAAMVALQRNKLADLCWAWKDWSQQAGHLANTNDQPSWLGLCEINMDAQLNQRPAQKRPAQKKKEKKQKRETHLGGCAFFVLPSKAKPDFF